MIAKIKRQKLSKGSLIERETRGGGGGGGKRSGKSEERWKETER